METEKITKQATQNVDIAESDHFIDVIKMIETGKTAQRPATLAIK